MKGPSAGRRPVGEGLIDIYAILGYGISFSIWEIIPVDISSERNAQFVITYVEDCKVNAWKLARH